MKYLFVVFVAGIFDIFSSSAQDFHPNIWSVDSGGKIDNVDGVTFFHASPTPTQSGSQPMSFWDLDNRKQVETKDSTFSLFSSQLKGKVKPSEVGVDRNIGLLASPSDTPFVSSSSMTTESGRRSKLFNSGIPFIGTNEPKIPVVSMKKFDQPDPTQSSAAFDFSNTASNPKDSKQKGVKQSIYDLSQFGIEDNEIPKTGSVNTDTLTLPQNPVTYKEGLQEAAATETDSMLLNSGNSFGSPQSSNLEKTPIQIQKVPTMKIVSGFKDHGKKPILRAKGKFIDFTVTKGPAIKVIGNFEDNIQKVVKLNSTNTTSVKGIALPGVRGNAEIKKELSPVQIKPFEPFVTTTTRSPLTSPEPTTASTRAEEISISQSGGQNDFNTTSPNKFSTDNTKSNTAIKDEVLSEMTSFANSLNTDTNVNGGGPMVVNHESTDDITNDLFNHRITGTVPDGIPPGEKLRIDSLYPNVSRPNQGTGIPSPTSTAVNGSLPNSANFEPTTANDQTASGQINSNRGISPGSAVGSSPVLVPAGNKSNAANITNGNTGNALADMNPNVPIGIQPGSNNVNINNNQGNVNNPGLVQNSLNNRNTITNNNVRQPLFNNVARGQNWQGQITPNNPNQSPNSNFANNNGQPQFINRQIMNSQIMNNRMPFPGTGLNDRGSFPSLNAGINSFPNRMVNTQNRLTIPQASLTNNIPNRFNNVQNSANTQNGMRVPVFSGNTNSFVNGLNNPFNSNIQGGINQGSFNPGINNGFGNMAADSNNLIRNGNVRNNLPFAPNANQNIINRTGNTAANGNQFPQTGFTQTTQIQNNVNNQRTGSSANNIVNSQTNPETVRRSRIQNQVFNSIVPNQISGVNANDQTSTVNRAVLNPNTVSINGLNPASNQPTNNVLFANNQKSGALPSNIIRANQMINTSAAANTNTDVINSATDFNLIANTQPNIPPEQNTIRNNQGGLNKQNALDKSSNPMNQPVLEITNLQQNINRPNSQNGLNNPTLQQPNQPGIMRGPSGQMIDPILQQPNQPGIMRGPNGQMIDPTLQQPNQPSVMRGPNGQMIDPALQQQNQPGIMRGPNGQMIDPTLQQPNQPGIMREPNGQMTDPTLQQPNQPGIMRGPNGQMIAPGTAARRGVIQATTGFNRNTFNNIQNLQNQQSNQNLQNNFTPNQANINVQQNRQGQIRFPGQIQTGQNVQMNNFPGSNIIPTGLQRPQIMPPNIRTNMIQSGGIPNSAQNIQAGPNFPSIPFGRNQRLINEPTNNFQNFLMNRQPDIFSDQFVNGMPINFGQRGIGTIGK